MGFHYNVCQRGKAARTKANVPEMIRKYGKSHAIGTFIETGTFQGRTIAKLLGDFEIIHTIELSKNYANSAKRKFKKNKNVTVHQGPSEDLLPQVLKSIEGRVIFWLDAHYSRGGTALGATETAILSELDAIKECGVKEHVILIDDMRYFGNKQLGYPSVEEIVDILHNINPEYDITIRSDILCVVPPTRK